MLLIVSCFNSNDCWGRPKFLMLFDPVLVGAGTCVYGMLSVSSEYVDVVGCHLGSNPVLVRVFRNSRCF